MNYQETTNKIPGARLNQDRIEYFEKTFCILIPNESHALNFTALPIEEQDARGAEDFEALEQCRIIGRSGGNINLQQYHVSQPGLHLRIGECEALHFLAGNAPVGVKIHHHVFVPRLEDMLFGQVPLPTLNALEWQVPGLKATLFYFLLTSTFETPIFERGCKMSRLPDKTPISRATPVSNAIMPSPFRNFCKPEAPGRKGSTACK